MRNKAGVRFIPLTLAFLTSLCKMIDTVQYRLSIGCYNTRSLKARSGSKPNNYSYPGGDMKVADVCLCLLYLYFAVVVLCCSMLMLQQLSPTLNRIMAAPQAHGYSFHSDFRTMYHVKYLYCLIVCHVITSCLINKHVRKFLLYKLYIISFSQTKYRLSRLNKLCQSLFLWLCLLNFLLIGIVNPSLLNPGPNTSSKTRPLKILYNNVNGLVHARDARSNTPAINTTKLHELHGYVFKHKPDIIILNETWLKSSIYDFEILPDDLYKIKRADRSSKTHPWDPSNPKKYRQGGGGVLIAHRRDIELESTEVGFIKVQAEILTLNFKLASGKRLNISTFYRVGTLGIENFEHVKEYLTSLACKKKLDKHVLIGDLNFAETSWPDGVTTVELQRKFLDLLMLDLGHSQLISEVTHKDGNVLDLLFTNISNMVENIDILGRNEVCSSDHFGITFNIKLDVPLKKSVKRKVYDYTKADWKSINFELKRVNWDLLLDKHDPHTSWPAFKAVLSIICDKYIPKKSVGNQFQVPWFDSECNKILGEKEKWRAKAHSANGTEEDHEKFRAFRKKFKKVMDEKLRMNVEDDSDPALISKKFWKHVKSTSKSTRIPETVWYKNKFRNKPIDQANLFNEFFYEQFSEESYYEIGFNMDEEDHFMSLKFHEFDVYQILKDTNPNKAAGPDGIHGLVLKKCASNLAKPLTKMFNVSFVTGCLPEEWKLASIVPLHKKGEKGSVENYRPISLTSLVMKVFEKCIKKELFSSCKELLDPRQHGFLNERSCLTQMVPFTYDVALKLNDKSKCDVIYFDFAKAFDSVSHDLILKKLKNIYKVDGLMLRFVKSYLQGRQQQVVVGGTSSSKLPVKSGVPQGSILGPLLFVIFINDMFNCVSKNTKIALYADDTKIWREVKCSEDHFALQKDIDSLCTWAVTNKMKFHPSKCKALSVTNQRNILHNLPCTIFNYKLDSTYIDYVSCQVDLGVSVSNKLLFGEHCEKLVARANSKLGLLMRTCHFTTNIKQKRSFYLAVVRSNFEHCSVIWRPNSSHQISKFDAIQKRAGKWIYGRRFDHYSDTEYYEKQKEQDILPIKLKFVLNDLVLFYKIVNSLTSIKLPDLFAFKKPTHVRYTRQTSSIIDLKDTTQIECSITPNCDSFRQSFYYRTMKMWNRLPYVIRQEARISVFKSRLTGFLWSTDLDWPD